jgi:hypothetical protein
MQQLPQQVSINAKLQAWLALQQQWPPPLQPLIHHHPPKFGAFHIGHQYGIFPLHHSSFLFIPLSLLSFLADEMY